MISIHTCPESRQYYDKKRAEGKKHTQAVLALARRRVNVLWALLRDNRAYQPRTARAHEPQQLAAAARHIHTGQLPWLDNTLGVSNR
jgi:hypothetical protein